MRVSEVFYSIQGEGGRAGQASMFVRLTGCSAKHACLASGVICDTEYESGIDMTHDQLHEAMMAAIDRALPNQRTNGRVPCVIWTGGEPLDQLTAADVIAMRAKGWGFHAIETSGVKQLLWDLAEQLEYIVVSPKVAEHILVKHFPWHEQRPVNELRYVRHAGQPGVPVPSLNAVMHYLSPHSNGLRVDPVNIQHCVDLCLRHPQWTLSVQMHKVLRVL